MPTCAIFIFDPGDGFFFHSSYIFASDVKICYWTRPVELLSAAEPTLFFLLSRCFHSGTLRHFVVFFGTRCGLFFEKVTTQGLFWQIASRLLEHAKLGLRDLILSVDEPTLISPPSLIYYSFQSFSFLDICESVALLRKIFPYNFFLTVISVTCSSTQKCIWSPEITSSFVCC